MRYSIQVNNFSMQALTLDLAIAAMASRMRIDRAGVAGQVKSSGVGGAVYGFTTGHITDNEWINTAEVVRNKVRDLYGEDGVLEVDDGATVSEAECGFQVRVWVWVSDEEAGISDNMEEDEMANCYITAADHDVVEFDDTASASMGDDDGAYVDGWIHIGLEPEVLFTST
jgi:hypothetical protein